MKKAGGFTLIELTVVLLILGVVMTAVILRVSGPVSRAKMQDVVRQIKHFDNFTRSFSRQHNKALEVKIDLIKNSMSRFDSDEKIAGRSLGLPSGFDFTNFLTTSDTETSDSVLLRYSRHGLSRSYALELSDGSRSQWLVFAGLTGEAVEFSNEENEENVQEILASLSRSDAD